MSEGIHEQSDRMSSEGKNRLTCVCLLMETSCKGQYWVATAMRPPCSPFVAWQKWSRICSRKTPLPRKHNGVLPTYICCVCRDRRRFLFGNRSFSAALPAFQVAVASTYCFSDFLLLSVPYSYRLIFSLRSWCNVCIKIQQAFLYSLVIEQSQTDTHVSCLHSVFFSLLSYTWRSYTHTHNMAWCPLLAIAFTTHNIPRLIHNIMN